MDFTKVEYLTVFSSIIYGFVASEYFFGWGNLFKLHYKRLSFRFIAWTSFELVLLINIWWNTWVRNSRLSDNIGYFFLSLTTPIILYLISVVTFPSVDRTKEVDLYQYLQTRFPKIMFLFFLLMISLIINTYFFNDEPFIRMETGVLAIAAVLTINGMIFKSIRALNTVIGFSWILLVFHIVFVNNSFDQSSNEYYTQNEYLTIFIAIIYGYVASVFVLGWGALIRSFKLNEVHYYHLIWTIFAFVLLVDVWWSSWNKTHLLINNIGYFYASLAQPLIFYLLGTSLFTVLTHKKDIIKEKFKSASPMIFGFFGLLLLTNILTSLIFEEFSILHIKNIFRSIGVFFAILGAVNTSRKIHIVVLSFAWIVYFIHLFVDEI